MHETLQILKMFLKILSLTLVIEFIGLAINWNVNIMVKMLRPLPIIQSMNKAIKI